MIGIFGGTFDPIHNGHLRVALDICERLELSQLRLVPLYQAVHRAQPGTPAALRLAMVQAAVAGQDRLVADAREIQRGGPSYTVETLARLRRDLGDEHLCLLVGADAFNGFASWHQPQRILELAHLVVMQRPGHRIAANPMLDAILDRHRRNKLGDGPGGSILIIEVTQLEISSSDIRARIAADRSARYLCPDAVLEIIEKHQLYRA